jgi:bacillithiol system protein YtxJ
MEQITDEQVLESVFKADLAILFKHSTICATSGVAMEEMEIFAKAHPEVPVYVVDVRRQRPLSQKTAAFFGIEHESPQVIVIRNGLAVWNTSHFGVTAAKLAAALSSSS